MNCSESPTKQKELLHRIAEFVGRTSGLRGSDQEDERYSIRQNIDGKSIVFSSTDLAGVLTRTDTEGQEFIQVNFASGKKILITNNLIGFKPAQLNGLEPSKLPRVVTTPDILSVFEAIQEALHVADPIGNELGALKKIYESVLAGGESVGFDLSSEREWIKRIPTHLTKASA